MGIKLSNNAFATLAAGINSSATSITVTSGQGARFPSLTASDYFYATLVDTSNNLEIVKCTARSTDVLTVVRGQESTTARAYSTGDRIEIRLTAQTFLDASAPYPSQTGNSGKFLSTNGSDPSWGTPTPANVSDQSNTSTGYFDLPSGSTAQRPGSPGAGMIRHNTTTGYTEYYDTGSSSWVSLGSQYSTWTETVQTINGGSQTVRILEDCYGRWVLAGRFAADAAVSIASVFSSVRGLSTALDQNTTAFSADFGDTYPSEVRVLGATDFSRWRDTRTIDFVYKSPSGRPWKNFFNGNSTTGDVLMSQVARYGFAIAGSYDGFGRWNNPLVTEIGLSDIAYVCPTAAFTTATANAFNFNTADDAKLLTIHSGGIATQDGNSTTGFGRDDNVIGFFDVFPSTSSNFVAGRTFSSAIWILLKLN
jgi:hypothetical protein